MIVDESSSSEDELLILWSLSASRRKRKYWVRPVNKDREKDEEFHRLFFKWVNDEEIFYNSFRMTIASFNELYDKIKHDLVKQDTNWRKAISAKERLVVCLRYLATGDYSSTIGNSYCMGKSTVTTIIKETCSAIWKNLQPTYMPFPTEEIWKQSVIGFHERWRFPNCLGSIDGKHVTIKCPSNTGSLHYCHKQKFSTVLLAVVDSDYKFIMIDVGSYGKDSDSTIFQNSVFYKKLIDNELNIPPAKPFPGMEEPVPHVFLGDGGFKLENFLMRPFPTDIVIRDHRKANYNRRLCGARRIVESAFGILAQKWRVFMNEIELNTETTNEVIKAACCLHNYLRIKGDNKVVDEDMVRRYYINARSFNDFAPNAQRSNITAYEVREHFISYFNNNIM